VRDLPLEIPVVRGVVHELITYYYRQCSLQILGWNSGCDLGDARLAIRIYALAKELHLDNKDLVDLLPKAGITGKGSALASLSDEEVAKLKDYLAKKSTRPAGPAGAAPVPERLEKPSTAGQNRPIRNLDQARPGNKPAPKAADPSPEPPEDTTPPPAPPTSAPPTIAAEQPSVTPAEEPVVEKPVAPVERPSLAPRPSPLGSRVNRQHGSTTAALTQAGNDQSAPLRRDDYMPPGGAQRRPMDLDSRNRDRGNEDKSGDQSKSRGKGNDSKKPTIRVAPINLAPVPTTRPPKSSEPAPQKPDIRLPMDVIRQGKAGVSKPLQDHMKTLANKQAEQGKGAKKRSGPGSAPATPTEAEKGRKPGKGAKQFTDGKEESADLGSKLGGREARQLLRKRSTPVKAKGEEDESPLFIQRRVNRDKIKRVNKGSTAAPRKSKVVLDLPCSLRSFSEAAGISAAQVIGKLMGMGIPLTITSTLDEETAEMLALELGVELELRQESDIEEELLKEAEQADDADKLLPRPPVVTFLGHVDHGKTSLLDRIIGIDVAAGESGGITQHIRAYQIERDGRKISFVDTPGHEAFTEMRARGANVTDIAVLVVAADDGVMPQTEEAISHARAAGVPIVVALNKIDLPGVDITRIYQQLAASELLPTEWGGEVEVIKTSAHKGTGIDELLETLFTMAELNDLRANPDRLAIGTCLESEVHGDRGVIAKVIVQRGTLRVGDAVVCGSASGFVKAMFQTLSPFDKVDEAGPSMPVHVTGLDVAPSAGQTLYAVPDIMAAREIAVKRDDRQRLAVHTKSKSHITLETMLERLGKEQAKNFNVIIRADTRGSIEAILKELTKLDHPEVKVKVLLATVGGVSEADIHLADASDAVVLAFNVVPDEKARNMADQKGVQIRRYEIIYKLTEDLKAALEGLLKPEEREMDLGRALVQRVFAISKVGTIAGCRVLSGTIPRNAKMRVIRDSRIIGEYSLDTLKREKDDAKEVREGLECGIKLAGFNDVKEGDILEAFRIEEVARTL
jgi:translation initiation factor IF-2